MTPFVPLGQALTKAREIEALREHSRVYLSVLVDQDDEITALKAEVATLNRLRVQLSEDSQMHLDRALAAEAEVVTLTEKRRQEIRIVQEAINALHGIAKTEAERDAARTRYVLANAGWKETGRQLLVAEDNVRALAEALEHTLDSENTEWVGIETRAALSRPGVVGGREEGR